MVRPERNSDDSGKWKKTYLDSLDEFERKETEWARIEALLRRSVSRLAVAGLGVDPELDGELQALRAGIRQEQTADELYQLILRVSDTVTRLHQAGEHTPPTSVRVLTRLLDQVRCPPSLHGELSELRQRLGTADASNDVPSVVQELAVLLNQGLASHAADQQPDGARHGLLGRLLRRPPATDKEAGGTLHLNELLLELLEKLDLPSDLSPRVDALKDRLSGPIEAATARSLLDALASLVADTRRKLEREKREVESFLQEVTKRLRDFDTNLHEAESAQTESMASERELHDSVGESMAWIRTSVNDASDLEQLKTTVSDRLDAIQTHIATYIRDKEKRHQDAELRIQTLGQRVREMETETSQLRQSFQEARAQAVRDPLTGLHNRFAYDEQIAREYARWKRYQAPLALIVLDLDRFKNLNDQYGHHAGDRALKSLANRLRANVREADFVCRYGGEEFLVVMPNTTAQEALQAAEKLRTNVGESDFHYRNAPVRVTVSCGVAQFHTGDSPESVFRRADEALYRAKHDGRNLCRVETPPLSNRHRAK